MDLGTHVRTFADDDQSWLGSEHGTNTGDTITLDGAAFLAAYPDGRVPSGVPLSAMTAGGLWQLYDNVGTDGTETFVGFLFKAVSVLAREGTTVTRVGASVLRHCQVVEANLPAYWAALTAIPIAAAKVDAAGRIIFV